MWVSSCELQKEQQGEETILKLKFILKYTTCHKVYTFPFDLFVLKTFFEIYF